MKGREGRREERGVVLFWSEGFLGNFEWGLGEKLGFVGGF